MTFSAISACPKSLFVYILEALPVENNNLAPCHARVLGPCKVGHKRETYMSNGTVIKSCAQSYGTIVRVNSADTENFRRYFRMPLGERELDWFPFHSKYSHTLTVTINLIFMHQIRSYGPICKQLDVYASI